MRRMTDPTRLAAAMRLARYYFNDKIWRPVPPGEPLGRRTVRRISRFLYLITRGFRDDQVLIRAPGLTLFTLVGLVPLLAIAFSISRGFGFQTTVLDYLRRLLADYVAVGQQDVVTTVISYVERTNFGTIGGIGFLVLLYTAISVMGSIERAFNDIWGVGRSRPMYRKISDYLSVLTIFPILLIAATGLTASLTSNAFVETVRQTAVLSGAVELGLKLVPILAIGLAFTALYKFMPYTTVRLHAAMVAGFGAGLVWHLAQWAYIKFQIGVTNANLIYGTFAALPIFLAWLNVSWIIVLVGCEIAYAVQHEATYHPPVPHSVVSIAERERVALQLLATVWKNFSEGQPPANAGDVASEVDLPRPVAVEILNSLVGCGLLARTNSADEALLPARDLSRMSVGDMLVAYRHAGRKGPADLPGSIDERVRELHGELEDAIRAEGGRGIGSVWQAARS